MKLNLHILLNISSNLRILCTRIFVFLIFFLSAEKISAQVSQDSSAISDTVSRSRPTTIDTIAKPLPAPKRAIRIKKDSTIRPAIDSLDAIIKTTGYSAAETLAHYPVD